MNTSVFSRRFAKEIAGGRFINLSDKRRWAFCNKYLTDCTGAPETQSLGNKKDDMRKFRFEVARFSTTDNFSPPVKRTVLDIMRIPKHPSFYEF